MSRSKKIGSGRDIGSAIQNSYKAEGTDITPGMLLEIDSVADDGTPVVKPQTSTGNVSVRIAIEKSTGSETAREEPKDVDYTEENDEVLAYVLRPGERDENGIGQDDISEGDYIMSNGDGTFQAYTDEDEGVKLAVALEDVDTTGDRFEYEVI